MFVKLILQSVHIKQHDCSKERIPNFWMLLNVVISLDKDSGFWSLFYH